ncbi:hypothetical protein L3X38_018678 [Prunus dulcis]|uniref:Reverse transcriptase domain-containing protein n=1 Tax=Prunus dulcis TaxID=3755 RepID=A0AAD4WC23_PRUDU|nr:hypothetical protein L3X38_018678 [Prunus dulcis]
MPGIALEVISHKLSISPAYKPVRQKRRSYDAERYEAMRTEVDKLQTIGFIREATYPVWLANSVMVRKATGGWRLCQDYTDLNKACLKDSFPLPRIDQLVDAYSGYNQIFMHPPDSEHTAFITDKGLYCYNFIPFGLKNAGATYQRLVNKIFAGYIGNIIEVYVDDMLVKSRTAEEHLHNLSIMFGILKDYRMRLNPKKCSFGVYSEKFIGFMISQRGIEANPENKSNHRHGEAEDDEGHSKPYRTQQLALALVVSARRLRPYFQAHGIKVLTNQPLRQVLQKPEISGRLIKWAIELGEFDIQFVPRPAEKGQAIADFISELTPSTAQPTPETVTETGLPDELDAECFDTSTLVGSARRWFGKPTRMLSRLGTDNTGRTQDRVRPPICLPNLQQ